MKKVFLGGTCNSSTWREELIPMLEINYFNPVVSDWTPECQQEEIRQKNEECNIHLYVITPKMKGVFSIAEAVESAFQKKSDCVFCVLSKDEDLEFDQAQLKSLQATAELIKRHGGVFFTNLADVSIYLNQND